MKFKPIIIIGLFLGSILILSGCSNKQPNVDILSVNYEKTYSVPESGQVPFEITLINYGNAEANIYSIYISGFWGSADGQDQYCIKKIERVLKPTEQSTYALICYIHGGDETTLIASDLVKAFDVTVNYQNKNNINAYEKITQKIISLNRSR